MIPVVQFLSDAFPNDLIFLLFSALFLFAFVFVAVHRLSASTLFVCIKHPRPSKAAHSIGQVDNEHNNGFHWSPFFQLTARLFDDYDEDNESEKALNFSELTRVCRAWYKRTGGDGNNKKTPFDQAITRATNLIFDDYNAVKPFQVSSAKSKTLISYLVTECNKWLNAHTKNQLDIREEIRGVKEEIKETSKIKTKKVVNQ